MKAIRVQHIGGPKVLELVDVPVPQAKGAEAVVKVKVAGVNTIDVQFRDGRLRTPLPFIPGQEGAGVVTAIGSQAKVVKVGDRVAWKTPCCYSESTEKATVARSFAERGRIPERAESKTPLLAKSARSGAPRKPKAESRKPEAGTSLPIDLHRKLELPRIVRSSCLACVAEERAHSRHVVFVRDIEHAEIPSPNSTPNDKRSHDKRK